MVRTEGEREKRIGMAREGINAVVAISPGKFVGSFENVYNNNNNDMRLRDLDKMEKDIVRITMIAEKDKRDAIACTSRIKKLREQLQQLFDNAEAEEMRRCHSESDLVAQYAERFGMSVSPPPSSLPTFNRLASTPSFHFDTENKSPNISPASSPISDDCKLRNWENMFIKKEDELARVKLRAKEEASRAAALRHEEEEMRKVLARETDNRMRANLDIKAAIARKEREIQRLSVLAERDKRTGMYMRDKIAHQKRTLASFVNSTATDKKSDFLRVLNSCEDLEPPVSPTTPVSAATGSSFGSSVAGSVSPLSLTPTSPSGSMLLRTASGSSAGAAPSSPLRAETDSLLRAEAYKHDELCRVSAIAGTEATRVSYLKSKCDEIQQVIAAEMQGVNDRLEHKIKQIRNQQDGIHRVIARAEMERVKACALHEELNNLRTKCSENHGAGPIEIKRSEFLPDKAYLSEFKDLSDLIPVADINTPNDPAVNPTKNDVHIHTHSLPHSPTSPCGCVDPITFIQSPPSKQISFSESQDVYEQKLQDIATLEREAMRMDEELARVKQLKEAEYARRLLLAQKLRDIYEDPDYMSLLQG